MKPNIIQHLSPRIRQWNDRPAAVRRSRRRPGGASGPRCREIAPRDCAFTRADLLFLLGALALLALIALPALAGTRTRALTVDCVNNLRRVGHGFTIWANDHGDWMPWRVPTSEGGTYSLFQAYEHFTAASNQFVTPRFLVCPADAGKSRASRFGSAVFPGSFTDNNLSYFAGFHANLSQSSTWLAGDRNITGRSEYCSAAQASSTAADPSANPSWSLTQHATWGNLVLSDGSVHQVSQADLNRYVAQATARDAESTNHILTPRP